MHLSSRVATKCRVYQQTVRHKFYAELARARLDELKKKTAVIVHPAQPATPPAARPSVGVFPSDGAKALANLFDPAELNEKALRRTKRGRALMARSVLEALCRIAIAAGDDLKAQIGVIVTNSIR